MSHRCGLYRAQVVNLSDPAGLGRAKLSCPQLWANGVSDWISPTSSSSSKVGDRVWIGFEAGDVDFPVWIPNTPTVSTLTAGVGATPVAVGQANAPGVALTIPSSDHVHQGVTAVTAGAGLAVSGGDGSGHGALTIAASPSGTPAAVGQANAVGTATSVSHSDHVHQGVTSVTAGKNLSVTGGDGSGHGALTIAGNGPRVLYQSPAWSNSSMAGTTTVTSVGTAYSFTVNANASILLGCTGGYANIATNTSGAGAVYLWIVLDGTGTNYQLTTYFDGQRIALPTWTQFMVTGLAAGSHSLQMKYSSFTASGNYALQSVGLAVMIWD